MPSLFCRSCEAELHQVFLDLGAAPLSNRFLREDELHLMEPTYPLVPRVCNRCWLVQLPVLVAPEHIFKDYLYFSSYSDSWLKHCETYVASISRRLGLGAAHQVVEIASNDGYLLQYFQARGVPVLGVEPAGNVAEVARQRGIPTLIRFFGTATAQEMLRQGQAADLLLGNNVLAHVPDLNDFLAGMKLVLKPGGVITMEFPHLLNLVEGRQFDTIYHEHFSYFSLLAVEAAFRRHGLVLFDVEEWPVHGGSLRVYARHLEDEGRPVLPSVDALRAKEIAAGYGTPDLYAGFSAQVEETKRALLSFLIQAKRQGKRVVGYGAPAKGNTLLNYCGIRGDFLDFTVDRSEHKQGMFLPGSRIPILHPDAIRAAKPDFVVILPWNLSEEIQDQMAYIREWGGRFVLPVPEAQVLP
jgi:SAM-dependent methyltransferase